jgi:hypothetical protein
MGYSWDIKIFQSTVENCSFSLLAVLGRCMPCLLLLEDN